MRFSLLVTLLVAFGCDTPPGNSDATPLGPQAQPASVRDFLSKDYPSQFDTAVRALVDEGKFYAIGPEGPLTELNSSEPSVFEFSSGNEPPKWEIEVKQLELDPAFDYAGSFEVTVRSNLELRFKHFNPESTITWKAYSVSEGTFPWLFPWKRKDGTFGEVRRIDIGRDGSWQVTPSLLESYEPITEVDLVRLIGGDQAPFLSDQGRKALELCRTKFDEVYCSNETSIFVLEPMEHRQSLVDAILGGKFTSYLDYIALREVAGRHQLWIVEEQLNEAQKLNGVSYQAKCYCGAQGFERNIHFNTGRFQGTLVSKTPNIRPSNPWGEWNEGSDGSMGPIVLEYAVVRGAPTETFRQELSQGGIDLIGLNFREAIEALLTISKYQAPELPKLED